MTILDIAQRFARAVSDPIPNSIETNNDTVAQLMGYIEQGAINIVEEYAWRELTKRKTITTVAGQTEYELPDDFDEILTWGLYDITSKTWLTAETPDQSLVRKIDEVSGDSACKYMLLGNKLVLSYPITAGHELRFFYKIKNYVKSTDDNGNVIYTDVFRKDTDEFMCDDNLLILASKVYRSIELQLADKEDLKADYLGLLQKKMDANTAPTQSNVDMVGNLGRTLSVARIFTTDGGSY